MPQVAFSRRRGTGTGANGWVFATSAGDDGPFGQQNAGERSQRGDGTSDRSEDAAFDAGSGSQAAGRTSARTAAQTRRASLPGAQSGPATGDGVGALSNDYRDGCLEHSGAGPVGANRTFAARGPGTGT